MKCVTCAVAMTKGRETFRRTLAGIKIEIEMPVQRCRKCGATIVLGEAAAAGELAIAASFAAKGQASGETLRYMRKALGMSGVDLAEMLDVPPETLSRWENSQRPVDRFAWLVVGNLVLEHVDLPVSMKDRLKALQTKPPAMLRLAV